ncbi:MAG TPA: hypothetical protein VMV83_01085 [Rectinemataceae bacterium]|nr:hypothetical protein [Rectinemataceae bacterium]
MVLRRGFVVLAIAATVAFLLPMSALAAAPNGCVSCHTGDRVVPNMLAKIKGHPNVAKMIKSVPDGCLICHKAGAPKAPTLMKAIHTVHDIPLATASTTAADVKGSCLNCHVVTGSTVSIKKAAANW